VQEFEFDDEGESGHFAAGHFDELGGGGGGASGGQDVVDDKDILAGLNGVGVHFEGVGSVFQGVFDGMDGVGKLLWLANGDETSSEGMRHGGREEVAARFDADHDVDGGVAIVILERVDGLAEAGFVFEQGGDVVEIDAGLGPVLDLSDERFQVAGLGLGGRCGHWGDFSRARRCCRPVMAAPLDRRTSAWQVLDLVHCLV
jgi:hypothetical protein